MPSKSVIRRVVLERCSRPLLARFLEKHAAAFFEAHGVSLAALAASAPRDRALVRRVFTLIHDRTLSPALPPTFPGLLGVLDALATSNGAEAILHADTQRLLPRATYGDEDLALVMLLDHPELAVEARREADADEVQSFTEYELARPVALRFEDEHRAALAATMGPAFEARGRTPLCEIFTRREGDVVSLEIVHGRRPKTFDKVDPKSLELDQSTDIHPERAFAELDLKGGTVAIHAPRGSKDLLRESLGVVLGADPALLRPARVYDLSPFADVAGALSTAGASPRLVRVELHAIQVATLIGKTVMSFVRTRQNLFDDEEAAECVEAALRCGRPVGVKLYLFIEGRARPLRLELSTKGGGNLIDFDRSDPEIVAIARGYLVARGVIRAAREDASPPSARIAPVPAQATLGYESSP